ncbi:unnamed protein product [Camellia sinensis]
MLIWADILAAYALWMTMLYLTNVWKLKFTHAAAIINVFWGLMGIILIPMKFIVDVFLGNYWMLVISSFAFSAQCQHPQSSPRPQPTTVYTSPNASARDKRYSSTQHLALVAIGVSSQLISLSTFMVEQLTEVIRDNFTTRSCLTLFSGTYLAILSPIGGITAISFIKIWSLRFGIPAICSAVATLIFLSGSGSYNCVKPQGSSLSACGCNLIVASRQGCNYITNKASRRTTDKQMETLKSHRSRRNQTHHTKDPFMHHFHFLRRRIC